MKLLERCIAQGVGFVTGAVEGVDHGSSNNPVSVVQLREGSVLYGKAVLDASGHSRRLVEFDRSFTPGYQ
eukprot:8692697-Pyramimonas_sp.AAC.1